MEENSTLEELFQRDPLKLTEKDIEQIISFFRSQRLTAIIDQKKPKEKTQKAKQLDIDL